MEIDQDLNTNGNNLWGPIELADWHQTPHIRNQIATEQDVKDGRAVFYIDTEGKDHQTLDIKIPSVAYQIDNDTKERTLVIVIQGEKADEEEIVGVRYLEGGNGVCMLSELDFSEDQP